MGTEPVAAGAVRAKWVFDQCLQRAAAELAFPDSSFSHGPERWRGLPLAELLGNVLRGGAGVVANCDVAGISVTSSSYLAAIAFSALLKQLRDEILIVWGGPAVNFDHSFRELSRLNLPDVFVHGPGEVPLELIVEGVSKGKMPGPDIWAGRHDVAWRSRGRLVIHRARHSKEHAAEAPPDYSGFSLGEYRNLTLPVQTAAGCPWARCTFCSESSYYVPRSVRSVTDEVARLKLEYGISSFYFVDSCLNANVNRLKSLCSLLRGVGAIRWTCMVRTKGLSLDLLSAMKSAGCRSIFVGLESLSDEVLLAMDKGCGKLDHLRAFRLAQEVGLHVEANFLMGYPAETAGTLQETIVTFGRYGHLWKGCRFWLSPLAVYPGSKLHSNPSRYRIRVLESGDENSWLPDDVRSKVPAWGYAWSLVESSGEDYDIRRLSKELSQLLVRHHDGNGGSHHRQAERIGRVVVQRTGSGLARTTRLTQVQHRILEACDDVRPLTRLGREMGLSRGVLGLAVSQLEQLGWLATSSNRVVTTLPTRDVIRY